MITISFVRTSNAAILCRCSWANATSSFLARI